MEDMSTNKLFEYEQFLRREFCDKKMLEAFLIDANKTICQKKKIGRGNVDINLRRLTNISSNQCMHNFSETMCTWKNDTMSP